MWSVTRRCVRALERVVASAWYEACLSWPVTVPGDWTLVVIRLRAFTLVVLLLLGPAASADLIKVVVLGSGGPAPDPERAGAAVLIEASGRTLLFDSGRGVTMRLAQAGYQPDDVDRVFLTHLHSDHVVGLADLWLTGWIWQREGALNVLGPVGTVNLCRHLELAYDADRKARSAPAHGLTLEDSGCRGANITEGVAYEDEDIKVTAFAVDHGSVRPALGYRIDVGSRSVVISGDTRVSPNLIRYARGVDILIHEVAAARAGLPAENPRLRRILDYHTSPQGLAEVLHEARPRLTVLTHLVLFGLSPAQVLSEIRASYSGRVEVGEDLLWIDVGEQIRIRTGKRH